MVPLGMDLFAVKDEKFMEMFDAPGAIAILQNERESLLKRQKTLHSCLTKFKLVATSLS
ncbi:putative Dynamin superfamily [Helianthus anomalus]